MYVFDLFFADHGSGKCKLKRLKYCAEELNKGKGQLGGNIITVPIYCVT